MRFITLKKEQNNYDVLLLLLPQLSHLFFISYSVVFVDEGRKNISCRRAQGTLATSLLKLSWKMT